MRAFAPSCFVALPYIERLCFCSDTTTNVFTPFTAWQFATGVDKIRIAWKNLQSTGTIVSQPFIEYAAVRPDSPVVGVSLLGSTLTGNGESFIDATISSNTGSNMWFRAGIAHKGSVSGTAYGHIGMYATWVQNGMLAGTRRVQLTANDTNTNRAEVITPWVPGIFANKVKLATVVNGFNGSSNLQYELVCQTAQTSVQNPTSNWTAPSGGAFVTVSGYNENCTTEQSLIPGQQNQTWIRFGLLYSLVTSGTGCSTATLSTMVTVRT
jgi:hypothetical protein